MRSDVDISNRTAQNFLGKYTERALTREGKRLYKKHPEYEYLKEDPFLNDPWKDGYEFDETEFYNSVVYAYMAEQFLRQKPEFNKKYQEIITALLMVNFSLGTLTTFVSKQILVSLSENASSGNKSKRISRSPTICVRCRPKSKLSKTSPAANVSSVPTASLQTLKRLAL